MTHKSEITEQTQRAHARSCADTHTHTSGTCFLGLPVTEDGVMKHKTHAVAASGGDKDEATRSAQALRRGELFSKGKRRWKRRTRKRRRKRMERVKRRTGG